MAHDPKFSERVRAELEGLPYIEKKMFGGLGYLVHGNMICGWYKGDMVARIDPARHETYLKQKYVKPFALRGRPMKGWLLIEPGGFKTRAQLSKWIKIGLEFALTLPPK